MTRRTTKLFGNIFLFRRVWHKHLTRALICESHGDVHCSKLESIRLTAQLCPMLEWLIYATTVVPLGYVGPLRRHNPSVVIPVILKGVISPDFRGLQIIFIKRTFFLLHVFIYCSALFSSPGLALLTADQFKTGAAILAVEQRLLSYNTCCRFWILRSENFSWLLRLPAPIELTSSRAGECSYLPQIFQLELEGLLYLPGKENDLRPNTKLLLNVIVKS